MILFSGAVSVINFRHGFKMREHESPVHLTKFTDQIRTNPDHCDSPRVDHRQFGVRSPFGPPNSPRIGRNRSDPDPGAIGTSLHGPVGLGLQSLRFVNPVLNFEVWRTRLQENCAKEGQLMAFDCLNEYTLHLLWNKGINPTPQAIIQDAEQIE